MCNVERWRAVLLNSQSTAVQLPADVLYHIFELVADGGSRTEPIRLSHVCTRWRSVSVGFGKLWSSICVVDEDLLPFSHQRRVLLTEVEFAKVFIDRSRTAPLNIQLKLDTPKPLPTVSLPHAIASRIACVRVKARDDMGGLDIPHDVAWKLTSVIVHGFAPRQPPLAAKFVRNLVTTRHLELGYTSISESLRFVSFPRLETLNMHHVYIRFAYSALEMLVAPELGDLCLTRLYTTEGGAIPIPHLRFERLHTLHLEEMHDALVFQGVCLGLSFPALAVLRVRYCLNDPEDEEGSDSIASWFSHLVRYPLRLSRGCLS